MRESLFIKLLVISPHCEHGERVSVRLCSTRTLVLLYSYMCRPLSCTSGHSHFTPVNSLQPVSPFSTLELEVSTLILASRYDLSFYTCHAMCISKPDVDNT